MDTSNYSEFVIPMNAPSKSRILTIVITAFLEVL